MTKKHPPLAVLLLAAASLVGLIVWLAWPRAFFYTGTIEATEITLSSRLASVVEKRLVQEGDRVRSGDLLLTLAGEDYKLAAELAGRNHQRALALFQSGNLPSTEYDKIRFEWDRARLNESWCRIQAPVAGTILDVYKEPQESVAPGTALITLADLGTVWAYIYVEQPKLSGLRLGQTLQGKLPEMPREFFPGKIVHLRDEAEFTPRNVQTRDERTRLIYGVKIQFENTRGLLKPGMSIEVTLP
jgi:HlyD family secretion protein